MSSKIYFYLINSGIMCGMKYIDAIFIIISITWVLGVIFKRIN